MRNEAGEYYGLFWLVFALQPKGGTLVSSGWKRRGSLSAFLDSMCSRASDLKLIHSAESTEKEGGQYSKLESDETLGPKSDIAAKIH